MAGRVSDRVALVTGGASGIGRATALRFAEEGADVAVADLNAERARAVAEEVRALGRRAVAVAVDTASAASCAAMVDEAVAELGRVDLCVAAAGIAHAAYVSRSEEDEQAQLDEPDEATRERYLLHKSVDAWQKVLDVNLTGVMLTDQAVARHLVDTGRPGAIVNIASGAGQLAPPGAADYCVSKAGVLMLTKCLAIEVARYGIRVNAVGPGYIETPMTAAMRARPGWADRAAAATLHRLGEPADIANACLYLCSDEAGFVTGEFIFPDGGLLAPQRS